MEELNYDQVLSPPKLKIIIGGKKYEVPQPSLQQIFDYETRVNELKESAENGASGSEAGEGWIQVIKSIFSCIPDEVLKKKNLSVLRKIAKDCTTFMQESMYADAPEEEKGDKKKEVK
jgi:hypothetical protein